MTPSDWQRSLSALAATVVTVIVLATLYWARAIFIPIALAIFLAFVLGPLVAWLQHRGLGRSPAVVSVIVLVLLGSVGVGALIAQQMISLANTLPDRKEAIKGKVVAAKAWLVGDGNSRFGQLIDGVVEAVAPKQPVQQAVVVESTGPSLASQAESFVSPAVQVLGQTAFTFILTVYVLIRREDLRNRVIRLLGDGRVTTTTKAVEETSRRISRYLLLQLIINVSFGSAIALALVVLEVKYALLWGFIAGLMRYVPYVGTWIALIPPVLFSFAAAPGWAGEWGQPIAVFLLYGCMEALCSNVIEPWVYGASMGLSEVAQLVAAAFWAFLWGPIGLILSGPLTACLLIFGKYVHQFQFLEVLLGDQPALEPRVAFYQRLAARDQDEAAAIALAVAAETSPDGALETVIVPALSLARRDRDKGDLDTAAFRAVIRTAQEVVAEVGELREPLPAGSADERVRVLVCPARDEAEHVAAEILASCLTPAKWEVRVVGDEILASELAAVVEEFQPAMIVLVALPPGGTSHCRYLVGRVRAGCPDVRIVVGRWTSGEPIAADSATGVTLGVKGADAVDRSLSETCKRLTELHPVLVAEKGRTGEKESERVGDKETRKQGDAGLFVGPAVPVSSSPRRETDRLAREVHHS